MVAIEVRPAELWEFFEDAGFSTGSSDEVCLIAGNPEWGVEVFLGQSLGYPEVEVHIDDDIVYSEIFFHENDAERGLSKIYDKYLSGRIFDTIGNFNYEDEETDEEELEGFLLAIREREEELDDAMQDFFYAVMGESVKLGNSSILEDLKEHFLEYMARKHGLNIYRPMFLEYLDGSEEFFEYPYEVMEFEDDNNPIYK